MKCSCFTKDNTYNKRNKPYIKSSDIRRFTTQGTYVLHNLKNHKVTSALRALDSIHISGTPVPEI